MKITKILGFLPCISEHNSQMLGLLKHILFRRLVFYLQLLPPWKGLYILKKRVVRL